MTQNARATERKSLKNTYQQAPHYHSHDFDGSARLTATLAHAIADVADVDVREAERRLRDVVDPDALDRLFESETAGTAQNDGQFTLTVLDHRTTIYGNGQIAVVPPQSARRSTR